MLATLFSLILLFSTACSHMRSGQHVYWKPGYSLEQLAKENGTTVEQLKDLNQKLIVGQWVFVPNKIGILPFLEGTRAVENYDSLGKGEFAWPVPKVKRISSGFGNRWGKKHEGIDIPAPIGTPTVAVQDGYVKYADDKISGYGNMIVIEHANKVFSVYAHLNKLMVDKGDRVKRGEVIAHTGNTGRSTGPHLHFEIRVKDRARDPAQYLGMTKKP
jgi:hypothetical protein